MKKAMIIMVLFVIGMAYAAEAAFSVKLCRDPLCNNEANVFLQNQMVFISYEPKLPEYFVSAILTTPDKKTRQLTLPTSVKAELIGPYVLEVKASGYSPIIRNFGVIEQPAQTRVEAPVQTQSTEIPPTEQIEPEPVSSVVNDLMLPQPEPKKSSTVFAIMEVVIYLVSGVVILALIFMLVRSKMHEKQLQAPKQSLKQLAESDDMHESHRFMNKVVNYIAASLKQGYSTRALYEHLRSLNWSEKEINEGFRRYELLGTYHDMKKSKMADGAIKKALSKDFKARQIKETLNHHSVILGKDASDEEKMNHLFALAEEHDVHNVDDKLPKLRKYISKCYSHGYSREMIRKSLAEKGWPEDFVQQAFDTLS